MRRQSVFKAITVLVTVGVLAGFLDLLLRVRPTIFGHQLGNYVHYRYGTGPGEMYYEVPGLDALLMWPDFETRAYYNGWFWQHRTDARGFRNPPGREADVVLLGDSLIYGHGVEMDEGVSERLHDRYGWQTYNLAQQRDGLYQSYVKARLFLEELSPRVLVHFAFMNDVGDLELLRTPEEIASPPELARDDWPALRARIAAIGAAGGEDGGLLGLPVMRFPGGLWHEIRERWRRAGTTPEDPFAAPLIDPERAARARRYYERVLADLAAHAEAAGAALVVVNLDVSPDLDPRVREGFRALVRDASAAAGVRFFDTGDAIADCADCRLANDGHLSPAGHAVLAERVDAWLREVVGDPPGR